MYIHTMTQPWSKTDGAKFAIAASQLFDSIGADPEVVQAATMKNTAEEHQGAVGRYGPADIQIDTGGHKAAQTGIYFDFKVLVKKSCDDDDEDADRYVGQTIVSYHSSAILRVT